MALRSLAARMRTSAASVHSQTPALRLSPPTVGRPSAAAVRHHLTPPRLSPLSGGRNFSTNPLGGSSREDAARKMRTKANLESASQEELEREAAFLREQIDEVVKLLSKQKERSDLIMKDNWNTLKLMACCGVVVKVITFAISPDAFVEEAEEL